MEQIIFVNPISQPTAGIITLISPGGTIETLDIYRTAPVLGSIGTLVFNLRINGVNKFDGAGRPDIAPSETSDSRTDLGFETVKGDILQFDLVSISGRHSLPLYFLIGFVSSGGAETLDDLTDVIITAPETDQILKFDGTNWINAPAATGGGAGYARFVPDAAYDTPDAMDDEFTDATLDAKWTALGTPVIIENTPTSWLSIKPGASDGLHGYYQAFTPSADVAFGAKLVLERQDSTMTWSFPELALYYYRSGYDLSGIRMTHSSTSFNLYPSGFHYPTATTALGSATQRFNASSATSPIPVYVAFNFRYTAGFIDYMFSFDGINWAIGYTRTLSSAGQNTITQIGFVINEHGTTGTLKGRIDWFRKQQGSFFGKYIS